jgi:hypothetical protein
MFTQDFEVFIQAYTKASPTIKAVIDSGKVGDVAQEILKKPDHVSLKPKVIIMMTYYLLSIITDDAFLSGLIEFQIDPETSQELLTAIKKILLENVSAETPVEVGQEVEEPPQALPDQAEPVYTTTQAAILREGAPQTPPGVTIARWDKTPE